MAPEYNKTNNIQLHNVPPMPTSMPHVYGPVQAPTTNSPPPLPPRFSADNYTGYGTAHNTPYSSYRPFGSSFFNSGTYGGLGNYRNYGGYNYSGLCDMPINNGPFGYGHMINNIHQYVEDSTRPAVSIVESVLSTLSSITGIVESTHCALLNLFRGFEVFLDSYGRMRSTFGQLLSTFSLIGLLKWIYRKLIALFGKEKQDTINEILWQNTMSQVRNERGHTTIFTWHTNFLFVILFVIVPYLMIKIMNSVRQLQIQINNPNSWLKSQHPVQVARVLYDFSSVSNDELNLKAGQKIWLAPQSMQARSTTGWLIATDGKNVGYVPGNYIQITGQLKKSSAVDDEAANVSQKVSQNVNASEQKESGNTASEDMISDFTS